MNRRAIMPISWDTIIARADILIVDDDEASLRLLQRTLAMAGYANVELLSDPRAVQARVIRKEPDLILLDVSMPHLDGYEVLEQIHAVLPPDRYLPVIVLTGHVDNATMLRALLAGAKDFMTKPLDLLELPIRMRIRLETRFQIMALEEKVARLAAPSGW